MAKKGKSKFEQHDVTRDYDEKDLLAGPYGVIRTVKKLAAAQPTIDPRTYGSILGIGVVDSVKSAKDAQDARKFSEYLKNPGYAISSAIDFLKTATPAAGIATAATLDVSIFGGATAALVAENSYLWPMQFGALAFGTGLALTRKSPFAHAVVMTMSGAACALASLPASHNEPFRKSFEIFFPDSLNANADEAIARLAEATKKRDDHQKIRDDAYVEIHGNGLAKGMPGYKPPLDNNGIVDDDHDGSRERQEAIIAKYDEAAPGKKSILQQDNADVAQAQKVAAAAQRSNPMVTYTRWLAAAFFTTFLTTSIVVFGNVLGRAGKRFRKLQERIRQKQRQKRLLRDLESPTTRRATATQEAIRIIALAYPEVIDVVKDDPIKVANYRRLHEGKSYDIVLETAVRTILAQFGDVELKPEEKFAGASTTSQSPSKPEQFGMGTPPTDPKPSSGSGGAAQHVEEEPKSPQAQSEQKARGGQNGSSSEAGSSSQSPGEPEESDAGTPPTDPKPPSGSGGAALPIEEEEPDAGKMNGHARPTGRTTHTVVGEDGIFYGGYIEEPEQHAPAANSNKQPEESRAATGTESHVSAADEPTAQNGDPTLVKSEKDYDEYLVRVPKREGRTATIKPARGEAPPAP